MEANGLEKISMYVTMYISTLKKPGFCRYKATVKNPGFSYKTQNILMDYL